MTLRIQKAVKKLFLVLALISAMWSTVSVQAQTVINVSTPLGDFSIELFDSQTPGTVQNFLNYINSGRFMDSIVHRSVPGFVIQGGGWTIAEGSAQIVPVVTDGTINNEPGISNQRGTVAMAKVAGDPNSATSQWFINLANNSFLDTDNGGFTVFGQVTGDGMQVVDQIAALTRVVLSASLNELPVLNFNGLSVTRDDLVFTSFAVQAEQQAPNRFDNASSNLILRVDAGSSGVVELSFAIESQDPTVVIRGLAETVTALPAAEAGYASFDEATGQLTIPELEVDGAIAFRNLVLTLTDANQLLFTLQSFE